jgi:hypothetical protein
MQKIGRKGQKGKEGLVLGRVVRMFVMSSMDRMGIDRTAMMYSIDRLGMDRIAGAGQYGIGQDGNELQYGQNGNGQDGNDIQYGQVVYGHDCRDVWRGVDLMAVMYSMARIGMEQNSRDVHSMGRMGMDTDSLICSMGRMGMDRSVLMCSMGRMGMNRSVLKCSIGRMGIGRSVLVCSMGRMGMADLYSVGQMRNEVDGNNGDGWPRLTAATNTLAGLLMMKMVGQD